MNNNTTAPTTKATEAATESNAKPMTRSECVAALTEAGYDGPTSYLMPKLREIVAHHAGAWSDSDDEAVAAEAARQLKNKKARERRAAKKLEAAAV